MTIVLMVLLLTQSGMGNLNAYAPKGTATPTAEMLKIPDSKAGSDKAIGRILTFDGSGNGTIITESGIVLEFSDVSLLGKVQQGDQVIFDVGILFGKPWASDIEPYIEGEEEVETTKDPIGVCGITPADIGNELNPYDLAGQTHNDMLDYFIDNLVLNMDQIKSLGLPEIFQILTGYYNDPNIDAIAADPEFLAAMQVAADNLHMLVEIEKGSSISFFHYVQDIHDVVDDNITSLEQCSELKNFLHEMKELENTILDGVNITVHEQAALLMMTSIGRYSAAYWYEQGNDPSSNWYHVAGNKDIFGQPSAAEEVVWADIQGFMVGLATVGGAWVVVTVVTGGTVTVGGAPVVVGTIVSGALVASVGNSAIEALQKLTSWIIDSGGPTLLSVCNCTDELNAYLAAYEAYQATWENYRNIIHQINENLARTRDLIDDRNTFCPNGVDENDTPVEQEACSELLQAIREIRAELRALEEQVEEASWATIVAYNEAANKYFSWKACCARPCDVHIGCDEPFQPPAFFEMPVPNY